jgi:hypothetical protein
VSAPALVVPFAPLPARSAAVRDRIAGEALRVNDRYLHELVEGHNFCPFARHGRLAGETTRYVHHFEAGSEVALLELMAAIAADPRQVVAQVILPLIDVAPEAWIRFCTDLTAAGRARVDGPPILACAPLHPALTYRATPPAAMVPLFRRAPDPTIQWVRLDGLEKIYAGRDHDTRFVAIEDAAAFLSQQQAAKPPLYHRIAETNAEAAHALGIAEVEARFAALADDARAAYARILAAP